MCYEDTYNTLKYANRAKNIKSNLKSNVISVDFHVSNYAKIVEELKQQVNILVIIPEQKLRVHARTFLPLRLPSSLQQIPR